MNDHVGYERMEISSISIRFTHRFPKERKINKYFPFHFIWFNVEWIRHKNEIEILCFFLGAHRIINEMKWNEAKSMDLCTTTLNEWVSSMTNNLRRIQCAEIAEKCSIKCQCQYQTPVSYKTYCHCFNGCHTYFALYFQLCHSRNSLYLYAKMREIRIKIWEK